MTFVDRFDPITSLPQLSEAEILGHAKYLSEDIGYRTVGTVEHVLGDMWIHMQALDLQEKCEQIVKSTPGRKLQCEVWKQKGSGSHRYDNSMSLLRWLILRLLCNRFDIMGKRLYKTYEALTNVIVRLSDGSLEGKENAVLVNSHVDSTLPSPGAGMSHSAKGFKNKLKGVHYSRRCVGSRCHA